MSDSQKNLSSSKNNSLPPPINNNFGGMNNNMFNSNTYNNSIKNNNIDSPQKNDNDDSLFESSTESERSPASKLPSLSRMPATTGTLPPMSSGLSNEKKQEEIVSNNMPDDEIADEIEDDFDDFNNSDDVM